MDITNLVSLDLKQKRSLVLHVLNLLVKIKNLASAVPVVKFKNNLSVGANYIRPDIPQIFRGK